MCRLGSRARHGERQHFNRQRGEAKVFIAMNRFRVKKGSEQAFESVWLSRDSQLTMVPGFVEFHLLKGPEHEDFTLYASHTVWHNQDAFVAWTKSEAFRAAHKDAGQTIRNSRVLRSGRPYIEAKPRRRVLPDMEVVSPDGVGRECWIPVSLPPPASRR